MANSDFIQHPHDKLFRETFSHPKAAEEFLRHYLPVQLNEHFDLTSLHISKETFLDSTLQEHASDVLYQLTLSTGQQLNIYILFEHKSYPDQWVPFQLLRYMTRIWEQQKKEDWKDKAKNNNQPLAPILPLVIYHGENRWPYTRKFDTLYPADLPISLRPYLPNFRYWLLDLSNYPEAQIKGWVILQACLRLLKYYRSTAFTEQFALSLKMVYELTHKETALQYLETMLRYAVSTARETTKEELDAVIHDIFEQGEAMMMTIAEGWLQQGMEKGEEIGLEKGKEIGLEKGKEIGFAEGEAQALRGVLTRTLPRLFGSLPPQRAEQLDHFTLEQLRRAVDIAFEVDSLSAFEAKVFGTDT